MYFGRAKKGSCRLPVPRRISLFGSPCPLGYVNPQILRCPEPRLQESQKNARKHKYMKPAPSPEEETGPRFAGQRCVFKTLLIVDFGPKPQVSDSLTHGVMRVEFRPDMTLGRA